MTSGKRLLARVAPYALLIRGIAHPHRLAILYILAHEPTWTEDLARHMHIGQNLVAHHLKALSDAGWIKKKRSGARVIYSLHKKAFKILPKLLDGTPFWRDFTKPV